MDDRAMAMELCQIFLVRGSDGGYLYDEADVLRFVPVLLKSTGLDPALGAPLMRRLANLIGVEDGATDEEVSTALDAHYAAHPIPRALIKAFERLLREMGAEKMTRAVGGLASFAGEKRGFENLQAKQDLSMSPLAVLMRAKGAKD